MTTHIFGMALTHEGTFSNNRGENESNTNTLQKVIRNGDLFSTVSAEAIRYALRDGWQQGGETLNRKTLDHRAVEYTDREFADGNWSNRLDDDVLGFMHAKKDTVSRRAPLEVTRAISVTPWTGETMHNFASPGSNLSSDYEEKEGKLKKDVQPHPFSVEVHHTRYQFGFALTPDSLGRASNNADSTHDNDEKIRRIEATLNGLASLRRVGGAHARYFADYSPEILILRVTTDPAPRMLYCFEQHEGSGDISVCVLKKKLGRDIDPKELIIGAAIDILGLSDLERNNNGQIIGESPWNGATLTDGVKDAVKKCVARLDSQA